MEAELATKLTLSETTQSVPPVNAQPNQQQQQNQQQQGKKQQKQGQQQQQQQQQQGGNKEQGPKEQGQQQQQQGGKENGQKSQKVQNQQKGAANTKKDTRTRLALFDHLTRKAPFQAEPIVGDSNLNPSTSKLGLLYRCGSIREDDDRVVALLGTFCRIISDYETPLNKSLSWDLDKHIKAQVQYLVDSRQHSQGMGNLIKFLRFAISKIPPEMHESDAKDLLMKKLQSFLDEKIYEARDSITRICTEAIRDNDVILTFGSSPLLRQVLRTCAEKKTFKLIVVDTRPLHEGLNTLNAVPSSCSCVYTTLSGAASAMESVTKVLLGASSMLANGAMLAPAGTAMVACLAKNRRIPVIVACESYKFCEKVQVDSIVNNELGNEFEIARPCTIEDPNAAPGSSGTLLSSVATIDGQYRGNALAFSKDAEESGDISSKNAGLPFQVINLRYDLTPVGNISAVATENGLIPPTSIPVLLRELRSEGSNNAGLDN